MLLGELFAMQRRLVSYFCDDEMASGLWPSSTKGKLLFDPVISFMGQTNEGSSVDSSQKAESSEHPPKETETVVAEPEKSESESSSLPVEPFEPTVKNDGPSESVGSQDDNKISVVGPSVNPETMQGKSRAVEVDQVEEGHTVLPREAHDVDVDEQKTQVEQKDGHMTQAGEIVETVAMVEAETPTDSQPRGFPLC
ncbi:hypothetical protein L3X38_026952 [Prunus dulcis]|uniref:Golgin candidate 5 n=1 Tax=Prunus dulcis TaxID=3755 RepID=A0AAD4VPB9_PRUDU|nr:hypothetical protein L3X38_026952 [Prunus dulcis]